MSFIWVARCFLHEFSRGASDRLKEWMRGLWGPTGRWCVCATHSVCPWNTLTEWMEGSLKSHRRKVVSLDEVTTRRWVGWVQQWVSSWSWPAPAHTQRWGRDIRQSKKLGTLIMIEKWSEAQWQTYNARKQPKSIDYSTDTYTTH
jgi:hypothetical protein